MVIFVPSPILFCVRCEPQHLPIVSPNVITLETTSGNYNQLSWIKFRLRDYVVCTTSLIMTLNVKPRWVHWPGGAELSSCRSCSEVHVEQELVLVSLWPGGGKGSKVHCICANILAINSLLILKERKLNIITLPPKILETADHTLGQKQDVQVWLNIL